MAQAKNKQIKSKRRVTDHGEVFTAEREVNAMLDLVKQETERVDSTFLEPACGNGNFLAAILKRKLAVVNIIGKGKPGIWESESIRALMSVYGVDLLPDNVEECQLRLYGIWNEAYSKACKKDCSDRWLNVLIGPADAISIDLSSPSAVTFFSVSKDKECPSETQVIVPCRSVR